MAFSSGTTLGSFEISGLLGVRGMGEVYRAGVTNLGREVAICGKSGLCWLTTCRMTQRMKNS